jgi:hypothetical protein
VENSGLGLFAGNQGVLWAVGLVIPMQTSKAKAGEVKTAVVPGIEGAKLRAWIESNFQTQGCEPLVETLCHLSDRLAAVRAQLQRKVDTRLINAEVKLISQFNMTYRLAGFADPEIPAKRGRPTGRMERVR